MARESRREIRQLADQLERAYRGGAWHGPSTAEALEGIDASAALEGAPNTILSLVRHLGFWLRTARARIVGPTEADAAGDWIPDTEPTEAAWGEAVTELEQAHVALQSALEGLDDTRLDDPVEGADPTVRGLLLGTLQHNAYHTGQIVEIARGVDR